MPVTPSLRSRAGSERSEGSGSPDAEILRCAQDDNQDTAHGKPSLQMSRRAVCYLTMRYVRWVTPLPALTYGLSSSTGVVLRCSNKRTPSPSRTGTRSMWISSSSPALRHCCTIVAEATTTFLTPAITFACSIALWTPSVTKVTGHPSLTHSGGGRWVTTTTGVPTGWWPPHPLVSSYNLRPATNAPVVLMASSNLSTLSAAILSFCSFLPIVTVYSVSPLVIQAKRCWKSSLGPATKPSRDIENPVETFPI